MWCDFKEQYERHTVVGEHPVKIQGKNIKQLPNLSKQFQIQFQFRVHIFLGPPPKQYPVVDIISDNLDVVMSFHINKTSSFFVSKNHELEFTFAKSASGERTTLLQDSVPLTFVFEGGKWNSVVIRKWRDEDGTFKVDAYLNHLKVLDGESVEDCSVFNNINVTTGYKREEGGDFAFAVEGQIRNFFVFNKYE